MKQEVVAFVVERITLEKTPEKTRQELIYCIPRTKYVRGILWFSRRYAASASASASAFHRLRDNFKKPYRIASIFYM